MEKQYGPAYARNRGVEVAKGNILFFLDSDVKIYPDTIDKIVNIFNEDPNTSALFGSYDDQPEALNFISQYKNLFHHYIHQTSKEEAVTFWTGCGAIRKEVFAQMGGFNETYTRPSIEDIELGNRLYHAGHRIRLVNSIQVTHLKKWTFGTLLLSDIFDRALPWTYLIVSHRTLPKDLNLRTSARLSTIVIFLSVLMILASLIWPHTLWTMALFVPFLLLLNADLYYFFIRKRDWGFAIRTIPLHWLYFLYSGLAFGLSLCWYFTLNILKKNKIIHRKNYD
ncbi:MAG: glycosyltransferase [Desulfobacteraceae bacterium]|nr:glycosyltransferase [Desulfobacteraceae bacterium]MBC2757482.1 glycosyltransferase [Desulfobacteraceae bacterium]